MIAIVPARGGSKGIPNKNITMLMGKPLIAYTIESALESFEIERVICSTDSEQIADIAREYGAEVPFMRPKSLASDKALAIDTYIYTIDRLYEMGSYYEELIVLLPTSPLRESFDIDNAVSLFRLKKADSVISYTKMQHPPTWARVLSADMQPSKYFTLDSDLTNRQDLKPAYICNGSIYIFKYSLLKEKRLYESEHTYAYLMPPERSVDIDTGFDLIIAKYLMRERYGH